MITVHHLNKSRSQRVLWLLEELGVEYEIEHYQRTKGMLAPPELERVHPLGKSPVVTDGDRVIAESGAIIEYFVDANDGALRPEPGTEEFLRYRYWMHYAEGSAMPPLLIKLICSRVRTKTPFPVRFIAAKIADTVDASYTDPTLDRHLAFWEAELSEREWFAGPEFTAADIQMSFVVEAAQSRTDAGRYARTHDFVKRIQARPAYQAAAAHG